MMTVPAVCACASIHAFTHAHTQTADDRVEIIGTQRVEWRRVLQTGYLSLTLELTGLGGDTSVPVGTLNLNLELLPKMVNTLTSEAELSAQVCPGSSCGGMFALSRAAVSASYAATPSPRAWKADSVESAVGYEEAARRNEHEEPALAPRPSGTLPARRTLVASTH
jgi:hypothetical protein